MPAPRDPRSGAHPVPATIDAPGWQSHGMCGPFHGKPRHVRNGLPEQKYYPLGRNTFPESMTEEEAACYLGSTWLDQWRQEREANHG